MSKLLTIVVPIYNVEPYINKCLDSLILEDEELMDKLEVIMVNDGTTDRSAEMSREYVRRYPKSFRQIDKENGGHGSAWNVGLNEATGKYLRFLDSDDWLTNLDLLMKKLSSTNADVIVTAMISVDLRSGKTVINQPSKILNVEKPVRSDEFEVDMSSFWCATYKTSTLKPLYPLFLEGVSYDDGILSVVPHLCASTYIAYDFVLYNYLVGRDGQSMSIDTQTRKIKDKFKNYQHLRNFALKANGRIDHFVEEVLAHRRATMFNIISYIPDCKLSHSYMKQLMELGSLNHIKTRKYQRFKWLPYGVFHWLEMLKRNRV